MARIKFKKGIQKKFLLDVYEASCFSWLEMAENLGISARTLADWKREKYKMSEVALEKLIEILNKKIDLKNYPYHAIPDYWNIEKAAKMGGLAVAKKYGGPGTQKGREKGGKNSQKNRKLFPNLYQHCNIRKEIIIPPHSLELAEFFGIVLGDGGINNDFQITITLNKENDRGYHLKIINMVKVLFDLETANYKLNSLHNKNVIKLAVSSVSLVEYLKKNGIGNGSKVRNQVGVSGWIKRNREFSKGCLRGLIDTDGGVYYHRHKNNGWESLNIGLCFTNKSVPLLNFVKETLAKFGFHPKISTSGDNVFLYREYEVLRYEKEIGFSNPYQKERIREYLQLKSRRGARVV